MAIADPIPSDIRALLHQGSAGVVAWNRWRQDNPGVRPQLIGEDLSAADLEGADLCQANLSDACLERARLARAQMWHVYISGARFAGADLSGAYLAWSYLAHVDFSHACLRGAGLKECNLTGTRFHGADLSHSDLAATYLFGADLSQVDLTGAILEHASLIDANVTGARLAGACVFGLSAWKVKGEPADQTDLVITPEGEPDVTADNLRVAQFLYLLLDNREIRDVLDVMTSKVVLILGRFTQDRKPVLDALRDALRRRQWVPVLFDFDRPAGRNLTETVSTLAHLARFVIADVTDARSIPQELQRIIPDLPSLPVQPIILASQFEYALFADFADYPWVLPPYRYPDTATLLVALDEHVVTPASARALEIQTRRRQFLGEI